MPTPISWSRPISGRRACRRSGATSSRTSCGTRRTATRPGSSATNVSPSVGGSAMAGWSEYPPDHPQALERHRSGDVGGVGAPAEDGRVRHPRPGPLSQRRAVQLVAPRRRRRGPDARVPAGLQRLPDRVEQRGARPAAADDLAAVLEPRRDAGRDRALHRHGPPGRRVLAGPLGVRAARRSPTSTGTRCGHRRRRRGCRSTSTSRRATSRSSPPGVGSSAPDRTPTTRRWASRSSWATPARSPP